MEQMSKMTIGDSTYEVVDAQARKDIAALEIPTKVSELINDSGYLTEHQDLTEYAMKSEIPSRTSEIVNDTGFLTEIPDEYVTEEELRAMGYLTQVPSEYVTETELDGKGFLTEHQDLSEYAKTSTIPTKVSQLTNDAGYLKNVPSEYVTDTELNAKGYLTEHQSLTDYAKKTDIPVVPTKTSQLTNDSGFLTQHQSLSGYAKTVDHYTKTESDNKYQPKGSYLTAIPSEYVTDTELTGKGYAKQTEVDQLSEEIVDLKNGVPFVLADAIAPPNQLAADGSTFGDYNEETEELYTGEGCSLGSDFNAFTITHADIYDYIEKVRAEYPFYITREIMGKDASGEIDIPRYIMSACYYRAYQKENYPKMYAWKNGSTKIYSLSVSPRIGDSMYSTAYVGTVAGTVSAVDNVNQTRTVGGVVYTKDETNDVEPTLVYIRPTALSSHSAGADFGLYDTDKKVVGSLSNLKSAISTSATADGVSYPTKMNEQIQSGVIYDNNGVNYIRYPFGDRFEDMTEPIKIVIGCNEHGTGTDEAEPSIVCARLIKDLATGTDNKMINWLRKNAVVIAVPIINPYGYDKHKSGYVVGSSYYNANNININRNYDTIGWVFDTSEYTKAVGDTTGYSPCGAYAGSENETQYIMNTIALGDVAVSYHTIGITTDLLCAYQFNGYATQNPNTVNTPAYITKKMNDIATIMRSLYGWQFVPYGEDFPNEAGKSLSFITQAGCTGGLIEMCVLERGRDEDNSAPHTALVLEACYTEMLTTLYSFINDYDQAVRI